MFVFRDGFTLVFRILRAAFCVGTERSAFMDSGCRIGFRLMVCYMFIGYGAVSKDKRIGFVGFGFDFS